MKTNDTKSKNKSNLSCHSQTLNKNQSPNQIIVNVMCLFLSFCIIPIEIIRGRIIIQIKSDLTRNLAFFKI